LWIESEGFDVSVFEQADQDLMGKIIRVIGIAGFE